MTVVLLACLLQDHVCPDKPPSQTDIDRAVARGVEYLRGALKKTDLTLEPHGGHTMDELVLAAMVYGGLPEEHEDVQWLLQRCLARTPGKVYEAVLLCVALDKLDAEFFLWKIVECAQFLLDNECENGQWSYGQPTELTAKMKKQIAELKAWGEQRRKLRAKRKDSTKARLKIELIAKPIARQRGDNSNTQVAALGLRIASDAGAEFPTANLERARGWWLNDQRKEGGWDYGAGDNEKAEAYISMTAGGVGSLLILQDLIERQKPRDSKAAAVAIAVEKGIQWAGENFTFHPKYAVFMRAPYSHYSIERLGILGQKEKIGDHPWYAEGAFDLLKAQRKDGSWTQSRRGEKDETELTKWHIIDTCLAILFFKRSVRPPVATETTPKK